MVSQYVFIVILLTISSYAHGNFDKSLEAHWALQCQDQQLISAFDLDDTVLSTPTLIYLFLKQGIPPSKDKPQEISLSTQEFAEFRRHDHTTTDYADYEILSPTDQTGRIFSFRDFRDFVDPHILAKDFKKAYDSNHWRATKWRQFARLSSTPAEADCILIITTRGHEAFRIRRVFFKLRRQRELSYVLPEANIYALSNWKYGYTEAQQVFDAKVKVMRIKLDLMQQMGTNTKFLEIWNHEGTAKKQMRMFQYTDDDEVNLKKIKNTLLTDLTLNPERWSHIKIRLHYTGNRHKKDDPAWSIVLMPGGKERPLMKEEALEESKIHQRVVRLEKRRAQAKCSALDLVGI